jgi:predicted lipoprotein with Yx(FWY)xxD motif
MRLFSHTTLSGIVAVGALALVVAACSSSGGAASAPPSAEPSAAAPSAAVTPAPAEATVAVGAGALGDFLVGPDGRTLYLFTPDSANTSTCADSCAENWPALTVEAGAVPVAGDGVTGTLSTFARSDGSLQVAINGVPLYYFAGDSAAGDTNGQGVGDKWFVVSPGGEQVGAAAATATVSVSTGTLGDFLVGPDGRTLYLFTPDSANTSTCEGGCAETWPPLSVDAGATPTAGDGVTGTLSTFARSDGGLQVAIDGVPLYYFATDAAPGDTNGQGVGGKWFVVSPAGEQIGAAAARYDY